MFPITLVLVFCPPWYFLNNKYLSFYHQYTCPCSSLSFASSGLAFISEGTRVQTTESEIWTISRVVVVDKNRTRGFFILKCFSSSSHCIFRVENSHQRHICIKLCSLYWIQKEMFKFQTCNSSAYTN